MKQKLESTKKFIKQHRVAIAITTTASCCLMANRIALKQHDDFLQEKGLLEEFYLPED